MIFALTIVGILIPSAFMHGVNKAIEKAPPGLKPGLAHMPLTLTVLNLLTFLCELAAFIVAIYGFKWWALPIWFLLHLPALIIAQKLRGLLVSY